MGDAVAHGETLVVTVLEGRDPARACVRGHLRDARDRRPRAPAVARAGAGKPRPPARAVAGRVVEARPQHPGLLIDGGFRPELVGPVTKPVPPGADRQP